MPMDGLEEVLQVLARAPGLGMARRLESLDQLLGYRRPAVPARDASAPSSARRRRPAQQRHEEGGLLQAVGDVVGSLQERQETGGLRRAAAPRRASG